MRDDNRKTGSVGVDVFGECAFGMAESFEYDDGAVHPLFRLCVCGGIVGDGSGA